MRHDTRQRTLASGFLLVSTAFFCAFALLAGPLNRSESSAHVDTERGSTLDLSAKLDSQRHRGLRHLLADDPLSRKQAPPLGLYFSERDFENFKLFSPGLGSAVSHARVASKDDDSPNIVTVAPPNDQCAGAEAIPGAGPFPYLTAVTADITDATTTGDPASFSCGPVATSRSRSIWYTFTPSATDYYLISSCADSPTGTTVDDTIITIYTGSCGVFTEVPTGPTGNGCDDDGCLSEGLQAVIGAQLNASTQYFIVVWKSGTSAPTAGNTAVQLRISQPATPANDTCGSATALTLNAPLVGTTGGATDNYELSGSACFTGLNQTVSAAAGLDVAYSFTAPSAGNYSFKVTNYNPAFNLVLYAASSCPVGGPPVTVGTCLAAANRTTSTSSTSEELFCVPLTAAQQIFLFVDENAATAGSTFTIEATRCTAESEPNGTPGTADPIPFGIEGSTTPAGDVDFFGLGTLPAGSRVFALVDGVAAHNGTDYDMRVTTTTDTLEYDDTNNDPQFGGSSPNIAGRAVPAGASFIRVNYFAAATATEPYRLYATTQPAGAGLGGSSATAESEPNGTIAQASSATNNFFSGSLPGGPPSTDVDIYSFNASVGDLIFLSLDGDPLRDLTPMNGLLALDDSGGTQLISVNDGGNSSNNTVVAGSLTATTPNAPAEGLVWRARYTGVYYARVAIGTAAASATASGDYLLSISRNGQIGPTAATGVVSGRVLDDSGNPIEGAVVNLSGTQTRKTITGVNGDYRFESVETNGFYSVAPSRANYNFNPLDRSFSQIGHSTEAMFTGSSTANGVNAIDTPEYFARQHYLDFLGREPDESGFNFWSDQMLACGADAGCLERRRINVSAAYFLSVEFQQTGGLVDGLYRASYGRAPHYAEFMPDTRMIANDVVVGRPDWERTLAANKQAFVEAWVLRPAFREVYDSLSNQSFVDTLISRTGVSFTGEERTALVNGLASDNLSRAAVVLRIAENDRFVQAKRNAAFVMMEYFGYLRRDPDEDGFQFWLNKLNQFDGNFERAEMVKAFINSGEYRARFAR